MPQTILFVDDEPHVLEALKRALHKEPYLVLCAGSAEEALDILDRGPVDVVVSDEMMPGMLGSELLAVVYRKYPDTVRIMLTGHANLEAALRAINEGQIYRFLTKPCNDMEFRITLRQAIQQRELARESRRLLEKFKHHDSILEQLETDHPGITRLQRDSQGAIILDDGDYDLSALIQEIQEVLEESEERLPDSKA